MLITIAQILYQALGTKKSLGLAKPLAPIGPKSGREKCLPNTSRTYPRLGSLHLTENLMPCWMTHISFGVNSIFPNSVIINNVPIWGTVNL